MYILCLCSFVRPYLIPAWSLIHSNCHTIMRVVSHSSLHYSNIKTLTHATLKKRPCAPWTSKQSPGTSQQTLCSNQAQIQLTLKMYTAEVLFFIVYLLYIHLGSDLENSYFPPEVSLISKQLIIF